MLSPAISACLDTAPRHLRSACVFRLRFLKAIRTLARQAARSRLRTEYFEPIDFVPHEPCKAPVGAFASCGTNRRMPRAQREERDDAHVGGPARMMKCRVIADSQVGSKRHERSHVITCRCGEAYLRFRTPGEVDLRKPKRPHAPRPSGDRHFAALYSFGGCCGIADGFGSGNPSRRC